jgi:ATP-dependent RNA helicase DeaD
LSAFKHLGLSNEVLKAVSDLGFEKPSDIQEKAIPTLLQGKRDFIGLAQTGTGKTAAFGLPLLEQLDPTNRATQALILAPTRELGQQIAEQFSKFSKYQEKINVLAVYGGASIVNQIRALKKPQQVIIATPGRLLDLLRRKAVRLDQVKFLVLDEADEMLNMGFKEDLNKILSHTPDDKLTWLFSATMPEEINRIVSKYMDDPFVVKVNIRERVNVNIEHLFTVVTRANKTEALTRFIDINPDMRAVVFCRTKRDTQNLAEDLLKKNYKADAIHGDLSQSQRDRVMKRFKSKELHILIATDVAARGIDVDDLTHVFHFTLPDDISYYTHRSGRTARAGKKGISVAFINGREKNRINRLSSALGISFEKIQIPNALDITDVRIEDWCQKILNTSTKGKLDPQIQAKVDIIFGNLSKEELIAKFLMHEIDKINTGTDKDLNESHYKHKRPIKFKARSNGKKRFRPKGKKRKGKSKFSKKRKHVK